MKKALLCLFAVALVLLCLLAFPQSVHAASADDLTFTLNDTGDGYIVSACYQFANGELIIPATYNGLPVTAIGNEAFDSCSRLTSITIPDSITTIDYRAFFSCYGLTSVTIPDSVIIIGPGAFSCNSLTSIVVEEGNPVYHSAGNCLIETDTKTLIAVCKTSQIPTDGSVTAIGDNAFYGCSSMTSVTIPDSVTSIGAYAFCYCSSLTSVTIPDNVTAIGDLAFYNCTRLTSITIPDNVTTIGDSAFSWCTSLTGITIPDSVTAIGDYAFSLCGRLTSVTYCGTQEQWAAIEIGDGNEDLISAELQFHDMEDGVCAICGYDESIVPSVLTFTINTTGEFYTVTDCDTSAAGALAIPATYNGLPVTAIGDYAFEYCSSLTNVTIPDSVTTLGEKAFFYCESLTTVTIPDSVITIGWGAFAECANLTDAIIGNNVSTINDFAFYNCRNLASVTIGNNVTTIGEDAFCNCTSLDSVTIGSNVSTIGRGAFSYCTNLTNITIPDNVSSIDDGAFDGCTKLTSITIPDSIATIGIYAFHDCSSLTSVIYCGTQEQWDAIEVGSDNEYLFDAELQFHDMEDGVCSICGYDTRIVGDMDGDEEVTYRDAVYLLLNTLFGGEEYPLTGAADVDGDGTVDYEDAVYLLLHVMFGETFYPLAE